MEVFRGDGGRGKVGAEAGILGGIIEAGHGFAWLEVGGDNVGKTSNPS